MNKTQRMQQFVKQHGGKIRFDVFAREHLMGETGFYSTQVDMRKAGGPVPTPTKDKEAYGQAVSLYVSSLALQRAERIKEPGETIVFAEIGGGNGNFKKAFLEHWGFYQQEGANFKLEYISVEPNPNHRKAQDVGGTVVEGIAQKTGLANNSVDFLFDEEVLDCMPHRVFKFDQQHKKITQEAFVFWDGKTLSLRFDKPDKDYEAELFECHLGTSTPYKGNKTYSNDYKQYWDESYRILKPGGTRLSIDYSIFFAGLGTTTGHEQMAIANPYSVDLTHFIDFGLQRKIALKSGFANAIFEDLSKILGQTFKIPVFEAVGRCLLAAVK